ncbi:hypothetical protein GGX14DRAFT_362344, partial [Mycena pura]
DGVLVTERLDPVVNPGTRLALSLATSTQVSSPTLVSCSYGGTVFGGSNFAALTNTSFLRQGECTTSPIKDDNSVYWNPSLFFQWKNGSFSSVDGNSVMYVDTYLYSDTPGATTSFPDDFRMVGGSPTLRSFNASSVAQRAITFVCLEFDGADVTSNGLPSQACPDGLRAQITFPSCWDGVHTDSADHKSHVAFPSGGPNSGTCSDPKFPKTLPRVFMEMLLDTTAWNNISSQAKNPSQPFVYSMGDPTGFGYNAGFINGWTTSVLQDAVDNCHCSPIGDPTCCSAAGIFTFQQGGQQCHIPSSINEAATGTLPSLPGNNPVVE